MNDHAAWTCAAGLVGFAIGGPWVGLVAGLGYVFLAYLISERD